MLFAVLAPEMILWLAVNKYLEARVAFKYVTWFGFKEWTMTHFMFANNSGFVRRDDKSVPNLRDLSFLIRDGKIREPPVSAEELNSRSKSNIFLKLIALSQLSWFGLQILVRAISRLYITALEISVVAFVLCSFYTYFIYWLCPQDVEYPIALDIQDFVGGEELNPLVAKEPFPAEEISHQTLPDHRFSPSWFVFVALTLLFGATHCLAWNLPFPTVQEKLAWRVAAICLLGSSAMFLVVRFYEADSKVMNYPKLLDRVHYSLMYSVTGLYLCARITLIILAFTTLRALPADAYQTAAWNNYLPHWGI